MLQAIPWQKPDFYYFAQEEELTEMLRNFCLSQGVNVVIDPRVKGQVSGLFEDVSPDVFLNQLSKAYGFIWFYDGNVLYVDPFDSIASELIQVQYYDANRLLRMLDAFGIQGSNFVVRSLDKQGLMLISGSPRFVSMTQDILQKLEANEKQSQGRLSVCVFSLRHSWAYDLSLDYHNSQIVVPGMANIIGSLMMGNQMPSTQLSAGQNASVAKLSSALPKASDAPATSSTGNLGGAANTEKSSGAQGSHPDKLGGESRQKEQPDMMIQPDVRLNAVIVRDVKEKFPMYQDLINTLDVPVDVISISAAIVDINTNFSRELGNKYLGVGKGSNAFGFGMDGGIAPDAAGASAGAFPAGVTTGFTIGSKFSSAQGALFLEQVQALETQGYGKVLSRPSVITLDNVQATLTNTTQVFLPVSGERVSDVFSIESGLQLKIVPHIINDGSVRKIRLLITIEDGSTSIDSNKNNVKNSSSISTQAVINEGESLLIGGLYTENKTQGYKGMPFLSQIPVLGYLFKTDSRKNTVTERLILITPTVISMSASEPDSYKEFFEPRLYKPDGTVQSVLTNEPPEKVFTTTSLKE